MSNNKVTETITSPNQSSRNGHIPRLIVCHIADGYYEGTKAWFLQAASQTSSHFIIAQDGRICQCVPLDRMAWCNGTSADKASNKHFGLSTLKEVQTRGGNANEYSVSIECEGFYSKTGGALTDAQLDALVWLVGHIRAEVQRLYKHDIPLTRDYIAGHYEVNPKTKPSCPGDKFPWAELMARTTGGTSTKTLYRVQVGAFAKTDNARAFKYRVQDMGHDAFLVEPDTDNPYYRVQVGAFGVKANAENFKQTVKKDGLDAFIVVSAA